MLALRISLLLGLIATAFSGGAIAQWEDPDRLLAAATQAMGGGDVRIAIDPNTRVPRCQSLPRAGVRARSGSRASIEIHCAQPAWRIYVPARTESDKAVAVLGRPLPAGHTLRAEDMRMQPRNTASLGYGYFGNAAELIGKRTRRALPTGAVLGPNDLEATSLVATGDRVTIISRQHGIEVRMQGEALSQGARDQSIRVRNSNSGRTVDAIVTAAGQVEVTP